MCSVCTGVLCAVCAVCAVCAEGVVYVLRQCRHLGIDGVDTDCVDADHEPDSARGSCDEDDWWGIGPGQRPYKVRVSNAMVRLRNAMTTASNISSE